MIENIPLGDGGIAEIASTAFVRCISCSRVWPCSDMGVLALFFEDSKRGVTVLVCGGCKSPVTPSPGKTDETLEQAMSDIKDYAERLETVQ